MLVLLHSRNGPVAEWLGRALQKLVQRFESARDLQKFKKHLKGCFFCCSVETFGSPSSDIRTIALSLQHAILLINVFHCQG